MELTEQRTTVGAARPGRDSRPDIDLGGAAADPGISNLHCALARTDDGSCALIDLGSTNGTTVNESDTPIEPGAAVPLHDGDRVHIGAWTTIVVRRAGAG